VFVVIHVQEASNLRDKPLIFPTDLFDSIAFAHAAAVNVLLYAQGVFRPDGSEGDFFPFKVSGRDCLLLGGSDDGQLLRGDLRNGDAGGCE